MRAVCKEESSKVSDLEDAYPEGILLSKVSSDRIQSTEDTR